MKRIIAVAMLLTAGCATIPDSGPVNRVDERVGANVATRFVPAGPRPGDTPTEIVDGFLQAMLAFPVDVTIASSFLTEDAESAWRPTLRTVVYDSVSVKAVDGELVTTQFSRSAVLDEQGRYRSTQAMSDHRFRMKQVDGEWRITNPPVGKYVSTRFFNDHYVMQPLYFFNRAGKDLIADPVHVIDYDTLPTQLITGLLAGSNVVRQAQAQSFIAPGTSLRGAVEVTDTTALVRLRQPLASFDDPERATVQIAATLLPLPSISSVRISAPDGDVDISSVAEYHPSSPSDVVYGIKNKKLVTIDGGSVTAVESFPSINPFAIAVHDGGKIMAVVKNKRDVIEIRKLNKGDITTTIEGQSIIQPSFDEARQLWIVDLDENRARVRIHRGDSTRVIDSQELQEFSVESFAISIDSARYAMIAAKDGGEVALYIGAIEADAEGTISALGKPTLVAVPGGNQLADVSWLTETHLSLLATTGQTGRQPLVIGMDGSLMNTTRRPSVPADSAVGTVQLGINDETIYVDAAGGSWVLESERPWRLLNGVHFLTRAR